VQNEFEFEGQPETAALDPQAQDLAAPEEPLDCGHFLAEHMLRAAIGKGDTPLPPGLYIVVAPSEDWCPALEEVVRDVYLGRHKRRLLGSGRPRIHGLKLSADTTPRTAEQTARAVEEELALGKAVFLITGELANVPVSLQRASDKVITVPPPRRPWITALIRKIATTRRVNLRGLACETVTPTSLRLAYRPGTSAPDFLRRLQALTISVPRPPAERLIPLDKLHGVDEAKHWAAELKADLARYRAGQLPWPALPRGLLLAGLPGTSKTTMARAIAAFCGIGFVATSYADWQRSGSGHLGEVLKAMAKCFTEARASAPAILFIDELDTLGTRGDSGQRGDWWRSVINAFLELTDGTVSNEGVILIGATNHPELIDPAILRSGRLEDRITLRPPGVDGLARIYADQLEGDLAEAVDMLPLGRISAGMSGADVVKICAQARRRARNAGRPVSSEDLLVVIAGEESQTDTDRRWRVAIHEAGHALTALAFPELRLEHVTIVGLGDRGGGALLNPRSETAMTASVMNAYLTAMLGGRAAEEILLGEVSAGAGGREGSDLSRATQLAAEAELSLGLRTEGLIWYPPPSFEKLANLFAQRPDLEQAVRQRLDDAYGRARELIRSKAPLVRSLARQLLARKVMTGEEVAALVRDAAGAEPLPAPEPGADGGWLR
jgi:ATP-dependent Zn protease